MDNIRFDLSSADWLAIGTARGNFMV